MLPRTFLVSRRETGGDRLGYLVACPVDLLWSLYRGTRFAGLNNHSSTVVVVLTACDAFLSLSLPFVGCTLGKGAAIAPSWTRLGVFFRLSRAGSISAACPLSSIVTSAAFSVLGSDPRPFLCGLCGYYYCCPAVVCPRFFLSCVRPCLFFALRRPHRLTRSPTFSSGRPPLAPSSGPVCPVAFRKSVLPARVASKRAAG